MLELFFILCAFINCKAQLELFTQSSHRVYPYRNYGSTTISNYKITPDIGYASFRFRSRVSNHCHKEIINVYIRFGSLPIIDPKNVSFPDGFVINNQNLYHRRSLSTKLNHSINIVSPFDGYYFVVAFLQPKFHESQSLWNLAPKTCKIRLTTSLYVRRQIMPIHIQFSTSYQVLLKPNKRKPARFQFIKPKNVQYAEVTLRNINFLENSSYFVIRLTQGGISHSSLILSQDQVAGVHNKTIPINCALEEGILYGINFFSKKFVTVNFNFEIGNSNQQEDSSQVTTKEYRTYIERKLNPFTFFFHLVHSNCDVINLNTNDVVTVLFYINDEFDMGGTLTFRVSAKLYENAHVIVCINNTREVPMKPNLCVFNKQISLSPMVLSSAVQEAVVHIPYPLSGIWYASFTMICSHYRRCPVCLKRYNDCTKNCVKEKCANRTVCDLCKKSCKKTFEKGKFKCKLCKKIVECPESNVTFSLASYSCFEGTCANGGICVEKISQGFAYSVCTCYNKFRGWTCSNGSNIVSPQTIHLELFLLLTSSSMFLVAGYVAFKRKYYEESTVFVITFISCFFSHLCESGKYLFNLCILDREKLFTISVYSGVLSVWVTVGAVACLRKPLRNVVHMIGAVLVAYSVILNVQLLYVGVMSFEILVGIINWSYLNVMLNLRFPSNLYTYVYLPFGIVLFCSGMLIFVLLQKESNFMYLHSLWHILLTSSYIFLIPNEKYTFVTVKSYSSSRSRRYYVQPQLSDVGNMYQEH